jgi:hypothetical protein
MSASGKSTKESRRNRARSLAAGAQKHLAGAGVLTFSSADHTLADIVDGLQTLVGLRAAVEAAKLALRMALEAEENQAPGLCAWMDAFEAYVRARFSASPDVLGDFGLAPYKERTPLTTDQQRVAVAKRNATRKARGTMGKRARLRIKGDVVGVVTAPVRVSKGG